MLAGLRPRTWTVAFIPAASTLNVLARTLSSSGEVFASHLVSFWNWRCFPQW
jgi:hypothetical protein